MTRLEYSKPSNLVGDRLAEELRLAGLTIDPMHVSLSSGKLVLVWDRDLSPAEIATADTTVAAHNWTKAKEDARRREAVKDAAAALSLSLDDAQAVIARAGLRVAYAAIIETRHAVRALIAWANAQGAGITQLTPDRTWRQVLAAGRQVAQQETDPEA